MLMTPELHKLKACSPLVTSENWVHFEELLQSRIDKEVNQMLNSSEYKEMLVSQTKVNVLKNLLNLPDEINNLHNQR